MCALNALGPKVVSIKAHILPFISVRAYLACIYERVIGILDFRAQVSLQISLILFEVESCVQFELPFTRNASLAVQVDSFGLCSTQYCCFVYRCEVLLDRPMGCMF